MDLNDAGFKNNNNAKSVINGFSTIFKINETSISYSGLVFHASLRLFSSNNYSSHWELSNDTKIVKIDREEPTQISFSLVRKSIDLGGTRKNNFDLKISDWNTILVEYKSLYSGSCQVNPREYHTPEFEDRFPGCLCYQTKRHITSLGYILIATLATAFSVVVSLTYFCLNRCYQMKWKIKSA